MFISWGIGSRRDFRDNDNDVIFKAGVGKVSLGEGRPPGGVSTSYLAHTAPLFGKAIVKGLLPMQTPFLQGATGMGGTECRLCHNMQGSLHQGQRISIVTDEA